MAKTAKSAPESAKMASDKQQVAETASNSSSDDTLPDPSKLSGEALALLQKKNITDLTLTFNRNSWVDIRDATGKHIIRRLGIAGNTQKVSGQAPFQVLLGYGHGVTIQYNGNEVDFSAFQGDRVARFTLEVPKRKLPGDGN
jgi:cytoskeleton protein RodZ